MQTASGTQLTSDNWLKKEYRTDKGALDKVLKLKTFRACGNSTSKRNQYYSNFPGRLSERWWQEIIERPFWAGLYKLPMGV